jgi:hypothetical protein
MTATTIRVQMAQRKDTAANWTAANPILLSGEIGYETDTKKFKIGDGTTNWNSLAYLPIPDGSGNLTITGNLEIGTTGSLTFEGSTANGFETTLAVTDPTADRTITLPNVSGTVVTTGDTGSVTSTMIADGTIVNADISGSAEIAVSKLANGTVNQVIVTDGTNVSWSDNLTLAGDLTVNGTTTTINTQELLVEDKNIIIGNVATPSDVTADGGGITLKGATDKTINWVDSTDAWTSSERFSYPLGSDGAPALTFTGDPNTGIYSPGADQVAISTNGTGKLFVNSDGSLSNSSSSDPVTYGENLFISAANYRGLTLNTTTASNRPTIAFRNTNGAGAIAYIQGDGKDLVFGRANSDYGGQSESLRLTSTGALNFVGAGTAGSTQAVSFNGSAPVNSLVILSDGKVGLGTSLPQNPLVVSNGGANGFEISSATNSGTTSYLLSYNRSTSAYTDMRFDASAFRFETSATERMRLTSTGLGIGTTSPGSPLTIESNAGNQIKITYPSIASYYLNATSGGDFAINKDGTERARIDSSGRLLVGTSSDSGGALLQVNDNRIRIATAKTPASATDTGVAGEICWDANYVYVCTATNTWKRSAISTW